VISAESIRETLSTLVHPEGGWGYAPGQLAHLEPTCLALVALSADPQKYRAPIEAALRFLEQNRLRDGSYRLARGRIQAFWTTPLVLHARLTLGHSTNSVQQTIDRLLEVRGRVVEDDPEIADMLDIDYHKVGWPWGLNTFSWVEPTSWACLALRHAGKGDSPRVIEGIKLLLDRTFEQGGTNYGNKFVLGKPTEPIPTPTSLMLLALQGYGDQQRIVAARNYLRLAVERTGDLEHLSWATLALAAHDEPVDFSEAIRNSYAANTADGRPMSVVRHALAALALDVASRNPFRLPPEKRAAVSLNDNKVSVEPGDPEPEPSKGIIGWISSKFRGIMLRGIEATRQVPTFGAVHIAAANDYDADLTSILRSQFEHFRPQVPMTGKRVVLKPNLVEYHRNKVINTDPRFVDAVIQLCKAEGAAEIIVAEGPGHWRNVEFLVEESGLGEVLRKHQVPFVDLNHDEPVKMLNLGRCTGLEYLYLTRTITSAEVFISLPKLKTHHWAGATLSLKNLFGTLPGICYGWPKNELHWRGIPQSIIDIALTQTPHLAIVDGIIGMEGDGPLNGKARHMGALIMGIDLVAVDSTCCRLMGLPPERVPTLSVGARLKLGRIAEADIPQLGEPIAKLAQVFELPPKIEKMLIPLKPAESHSA
jgi:uncharacterized protein (DUF362 family)